MTRSERLLALVAICAPAWGCGSSSSAAPDDGGASPEAGSGVPSQAAFSGHLLPSDGGGACPPGSHWVNVPDAPSGAQQTTTSMKAVSAVDGVGGMQVSCSVKPNGAGFDVQASLRSPATNVIGQVLAPTIVSLSTSIAPGDSMVGGMLSLTDARTATAYSSDACVFSVHPLKPADQVGVAAGRLWAAFTCPFLSDPANPDPSTACQIESGALVLEQCDMQ